MTTKTKIRGNKQIKDLSITSEDIASNAAIETSKLAEGQEFLKRDGSVPLTGDLDAGGNKIENLGAPVGDNDAARKIDYTSADAIIQQNIDNEATAQQAADDLLDGRLDVIENKNLEQDGKLNTAESDINSLEVDLTAEEVARIAADENLQDQIDEATNGAFVSREVPSGVLDGVNTVYVLAHTPDTGTEQVYLNGALQNPGASNDYTISGAIITFAVPPISTDVILVNYFYDGIISGGGTVDLSGIEADIDQLQADLITLDTRLDAAELDVDNLQAESTSLDGRIDALESSSGDTSAIEADIDALEIRATSAEGNITNIEADVVAADLVVDSLETTQSSLATVATTGSYNDLLDKPTSLGGMNVDWQYFSSSGTWTKPAGAKMVHVICVSGGSGGTAGRRNNTAASRFGGGGGSGGPIAMACFNANQLNSTETVTVGLGGNGGTAQSSGTTISYGTSGGSSYFGGNSFPACKLGSQSAAAPSNNQNGASSTSTNTLYTLKNNPGGSGVLGSAAAGSTGSNSIFYEFGCPGGAGGGSVSATNEVFKGGNRNLLERNFGYIVATSAGYSIDPNTGGQTAGANGSNGLNATTDGTSSYILGGGGAGGAGVVTGAAGNGGNGGTPGGGGGGGGGCFDSVGQSSGAGGSGGNGGVYVITYF